MPESVRDRPSTSYEHVFLLSKSKRYYYDIEAVKELSENGGKVVSLGDKSFSKRQADGMNVNSSGNALKSTYTVLPTRNLRSVWTINPRGFKEAHFATFPTTLVEPMMKAGTSERGCCENCEAPWERVIGKGLTAHDGTTNSAYENGMTANRLALLRQAARERGQEYANISTTLGWRPACTCYQSSPWPFGRKKIKPDMLSTVLPLLEEYSTLPTVPCTALDPFGGAGTVGVVGVQLNRDAILCELNEEYCDMSRRRIGKIEFIEHVGIDNLTKEETYILMEQISMFPAEVL
jgi:hypothetical protein